AIELTSHMIELIGLWRISVLVVQGQPDAISTSLVLGILGIDMMVNESSITMGLIYRRLLHTLWKTIWYIHHRITVQNQKPADVLCIRRGLEFIETGLFGASSRCAKLLCSMNGMDKKSYAVGET